MSKIDLSTKVGSVQFRNPIILASGTIGAGLEYQELIDYSKIGGIVTKTVTPKAKLGNLPPRISEQENGIINSIGLQNPGIDVFIEEYFDFLENLDTNVIFSIGGSNVDELAYCAEKVKNLPFIVAVEVNLSCPNVAAGGLSYSMSPGSTASAVTTLKKIIKKPLWVKLTPQVANISEIGLIAQESGADVICAINTVPAFDIDLLSMKASLGNGIGGLSGPAIFPIAMRSIYMLSKVLDIPIVGIGGVDSAEKGLKFLSIGASAFQIGTALFREPELPQKMIPMMENILRELQIQSIDNLIGVFGR